MFIFVCVPLFPARIRGVEPPPPGPGRPADLSPEGSPPMWGHVWVPQSGTQTLDTSLMAVAPRAGGAGVRGRGHLPPSQPHMPLCTCVRHGRRPHGPTPSSAVPEVRVCVVALSRWRAPLTLSCVSVVSVVVHVFCPAPGPVLVGVSPDLGWNGAISHWAAHVQPQKVGGTPPERGAASRRPPALLKDSVPTSVLHPRPRSLLFGRPGRGLTTGCQPSPPPHAA
jgi:hypothetical protein